jgi:two-component system, OmpR family, response regulator ChvI
MTKKCKIPTTATKIRRILVVDNEPDVTFTIKATLEESGLFQVATFYDAECALAIFRPDRYDLAVLDIRMPKMNGFQLCRKLKEIDKKLKICFLTAAELLHYRETDSDIIEEIGSDCFIAKPIGNEDILNRLKSILSRR